MTALKMTVDEALALADQWCAGLTMDTDSKGWGAILLVLATEVRRLREREAGLLDQHHRDSAELRRVCAERDEARADERTAMGYLAGVRQVVGGEDFPDMVLRVGRLRADAERYRWLRAEHDPADLPIAQVVWKRGNDPHADWVNLVDGGDLDRHIDAAMEASNAG